MSKFDEMLKSNEWHPLNELQSVVDALKPLMTPDPEKLWQSISGWKWTSNPGWRAKYVSIHIDMRDGGFVLLDRDGNRISLEEIQVQTKREKK